MKTKHHAPCTACGAPDALKYMQTPACGTWARKDPKVNTHSANTTQRRHYSVLTRLAAKITYGMEPKFKAAQCEHCVGQHYVQHNSVPTDLCRSHNAIVHGRWAKTRRSVCGTSTLFRRLLHSQVSHGAQSHTRTPHMPRQWQACTSLAWRRCRSHPMARG